MPANRTMDIKISVIVPVYNVIEYIDKCVSSLIKQSLKEIEIILVDDGSTDGSGNKCDEYAEKYDNVYSYHRQNCGSAASRNFGFRHAKGIYAYFMDGDDWLEQNALERIYNEAVDKDLDILLFAAETVYDGNREDYELRFRTEQYKRMQCLYEVMKGVKLFERLYRADEMYVSAVLGLYRAAYLIQRDLLMPEDMRIHEDIPFAFWSLIYADRAECIPDALYYRRIRKGSLMTSSDPMLSICNHYRAWINICVGLEKNKQISSDDQRLLFIYSDTLLEKVSSSYCSFMNVDDRDRFVCFKDEFKEEIISAEEHLKTFNRDMWLFYYDPVKYRERFNCKIEDYKKHDFYLHWDIERFNEKIASVWNVSDTYDFITGINSYEKSNNGCWAKRKAEILLNISNKSRIVVHTYNVKNEKKLMNRRRIYFYINGKYRRGYKMRKGIQHYEIDISDVASEICSLGILTNYTILNTNGDIREMSYILKKIEAF